MNMESDGDPSFRFIDGDHQYAWIASHHGAVYIEPGDRVPIGLTTERESEDDKGGDDK